MIEITVSSVNEAVRRAREIFAQDMAVEWVVAIGAATTGGAMFAANGDIVMHRSEKAAWTGGRTVEETQAAITAS